MQATYYENSMVSGVLAALVALGCGESGSPIESNVAQQPATAEAREQIVYHGVTGNASGLVLVNSDGSGAVSLTSAGRSPAWSPDGTRLLFSNTTCDTDWWSYYRCDNGGLLMMNVETRQLTTTANGARGEDPAWAPSGDLIAFVRYDESTGRGRRLFVMRLDGSEPREVPTPVNEVFAPSWSPDGKRIVFQCHRSHMGICVVNADGTGFAHLTASTSGQSEVSPAWSPDSMQIAFAILTGGSGKIALMSAYGSERVVLTDGLQPAWSPDGTKLAFSRNNDGIFTMSRDGSSVKRLTSGNHYSPDWRPADPCNGCWDY